MNTGILPLTKRGWISIYSALIGIAAWIILPLITINFREQYPVTDTWIMPLIGIVIIDIAAVLNILSIWRWHERSILNIVSAILVIPAAALLSVITIGQIEIIS